MQLLPTSSWCDSVLQNWTSFCGNKQEAPIWHLKATAQGPVPGKCWPLDVCCHQFFFFNTQQPTPSADPHSSLGIYVQLFIRSSGRKIPDLLRNNSEKSMNIRVQQLNDFVWSTEKTSRLPGLYKKQTGNFSFEMGVVKVSEYYMESRHRRQGAISYWSISVKVLLSYNATLNKKQWTQDTVWPWVLSEGS